MLHAMRAGSQSATAQDLLSADCPTFFSKTEWLKGLLSRYSSKSGPSGLPVPPDPDVYKRPRDTRIFPVGLGEKIADMNSRQHPHNYAAEELRALFLQDHNAAANVDHICVLEASYCKQQDGPKHEFILLRVQDIRYPNLTNFIVLDRTARSPSKGPHRYKSCATSEEFFDAVTQTPAYDRFRVSHYGDSNTLIEHCDLKPYQAIESLSFNTAHPLRFYELVVLAQATTSARIMYKLFNAQCYWFASTVWECMQQLTPKARLRIHKPIRGSLHVFQQLTNSVELHQIMEVVRGGILEFKNELSIRIHVSWSSSIAKMRYKRIVFGDRNLQEIMRNPRGKKRLNSSERMSGSGSCYKRCNVGKLDVSFTHRAFGKHLSKEWSTYNMSLLRLWVHEYTVFG